MSIDVSIQNFRNIKEGRLVDENPFSLIIGLNESGKSSVIGAIQFVLTGTAFGRKAGQTVDGLVTRGHDKMAVRLSIGNQMFARTRSTGDPLKSVAERLGVVPEMLPLMFNSKMSGDGGSKAMRAFLDGSASVAFDAMTHFATDPAISELVLKARSAGKLTTKAIIEYCESMRGSCRAPAAPTLPAFARPTQDLVLEAGNRAGTAAVAVNVANTEYTDSAQLGQKLAKLNAYKAALATYEKQRAAASLVDPLKDRRQALMKVVNINLDSLLAINAILTAAGFADHGVIAVVNNVSHTKMLVNEELVKNPAPATMPQPPILEEDAFAVAIELGAPSTSAVDAAGFFTTDTLRDLIIDNASCTQAAQQALSQARAFLDQSKNAAQALIKQVGAYEEYDRTLPNYEENKLMAETEWKRWDTAAKTISAAETEHVNKAGDVFGQLVSDFSAPILQGRKIRVSRDDGIWLGQDRIEDCSESTRWRIEAAIMAAIAVMLKSPLLLLDGADVLDPANKAVMTTFLIQNIVPRFKHTIVTTTTSRKLEEELPAEPGCGVTKWIINDGALRRL